MGAPKESIMSTKKHNKQPAFNYQFLKDPVATHIVTGELPQWSHITIPEAEKAMHYRFKDADILDQKLSRCHFNANLVEVNTKTPIHLNFRILKDQLFALFMMEGGITFATNDGRHVIETGKNRFYLSYNKPGLFTAEMQPGRHIALVVAIKIRWVKNIFADRDVLNTFLNDAKASSEQFQVLPLCKIDKKLTTSFNTAVTATDASNDTLDSYFRTFMTESFDRYAQFINKGEGLLAYNVRCYIDNHYTDEGLADKKLADLHHTTLSTLRNQFNAAYRISPNDYRTHRRMLPAKMLFESTDQRYASVYSKVGYKDASSFRRAYINYWKKH